MQNEEITSYPRLDMELIDELKFALEDGLPDLFKIFLDDAPVRVNVIRKAIDEGDYAEVRRAGHTLNGGCATFGANRLSKICEDMSNACKNNEDKSVLLSILSEMEKELHEVSKSLVVLLNDLE